MKKIIFIIAFTTTFNLICKENYIHGLFINPLDRYVSMEMEPVDMSKSTDEEFIEDIIEVVSGMIYGWSFSYVPSDNKRQIKEAFTTEPIARIKKGDPNMRFRDSWVKDNIKYQNLYYHLNDYQKKRLKSWKTTVNPTSSGSGVAFLMDKDSKSLSLKDALKDSIKKEFQSRGEDKPRKIEGQILLSKAPRTFVNAGEFKTQVKVIIIYKEVKKYRYQ